MVIDVLVDMALDYVSEKAFKMSMDSAVHYALNFKDRRELKERLDSEMAKSIEEIPVSECTRRIIGSDGRYGTAFKKGIVNSVLMLNDQPDAASEMGIAGALLRGRRKEKDWFVTRPPIPKENLDTVRGDVDRIVEHMQDAMWDNPLFRRIVGDEEFQEKVLADMDDLRMEMADIRRELAEVKAKVSEIKDEMSEVKATVSDLSDKMVAVTVVPSPKDPSDAFTGREGELRALEAAVSEKGMVFVNGFGGIGKTELCMKFSSDYSKRTGCKVVWTTFEESIRRTIAAVKLSDDSEESADIDERFQRCKRIISSEGDILLVIDNFEWGADLSDIEDIGCKVLLTTREESIPAEYRTVTLGELSPDESFELLKAMATEENSRWVDDNEVGIRRKLEEVGYHTLTVTLMGGLIAEEEPDRSETVDEVLDFTGCEVYSRDRGYKTVMDHIRAIFKLSSLDEGSVDILRMAAILPVSGMERSLFMECSGADKKSLKKLVRSGWLKRTESEDRSMISVHPMISELVWEEHRPSISEGDPCRSFVNKALDRINSINKTEIAVSLVPFFDIVVKLKVFIFKNSEDGSNPSFAIWSLSTIYNSHRIFGMYTECLGICKRAMYILGSMENPKELDLANWLYNVGSSYWDLREYDKALKFYLDALKSYGRAMPEGLPYYATTLSCLGKTCSALGQYDNALEFHSKALELRESILPEGHPDIALSVDCIGSVYACLGDNKKALLYHLKALVIFKGALPEGHPYITASLDNIGNVYSHLGEYENALEYHLRALATREYALPEGHPAIARSLDNIGNVYLDLEDYENALKYHLRALEIFEKALPEGHPDIAKSLNNVGEAYLGLGEYNEALKPCLRALEIYEKALPEEHLHIAMLMNNVGEAYMGLREFDKSLEYYLRGLSIIEEILPNDHPGIIHQYNLIGLLYCLNGQ